MGRQAGGGGGERGVDDAAAEEDETALVHTALALERFVALSL